MKWIDRDSEILILQYLDIVSLIFFTSTSRSLSKLFKRCPPNLIVHVKQKQIYNLKKINHLIQDLFVRDLFVQGIHNGHQNNVAEFPNVRRTNIGMYIHEFDTVKQSCPHLTTFYITYTDKWFSDHFTAFSSLCHVELFHYNEVDDMLNGSSVIKNLLDQTPQLKTLQTTATISSSMFSNNQYPNLIHLTAKLAAGKTYGLSLAKVFPNLKYILFDPENDDDWDHDWDRNTFSGLHAFNHVQVFQIFGKAIIQTHLCHSILELNIHISSTKDLKRTIKTIRCCTNLVALLLRIEMFEDAPCLRIVHAISECHQLRYLSLDVYSNVEIGFVYSLEKAPVNCCVYMNHQMMENKIHLANYFSQVEVNNIVDQPHFENILVDEEMIHHRYPYRRTLVKIE